MDNKPLQLNHITQITLNYSKNSLRKILCLHTQCNVKYYLPPNLKIPRKELGKGKFAK